MGTESEACVDELLLKTRRVEELNQALAVHSNKELVEEARQLVRETQLYIDNQKLIIPPFILKQVSEALRKLERHIDNSNKSKLTFKFKTKPSDKISAETAPRTCTSTSTEPSQTIETDVVEKNFFGLRRRSGKRLSLGPDEVDSKDVSLVELESCSVVVRGLANTVYIRNLKNTTVAICLASRAITVKDCTDCRFILVCQQLRIDSTMSSEFSIFTSARSMLEASKDLIFKELKLDDISDFKLSQEQVQQLLARARFNIAQNKWRCIDDFDWLAPDVPSKNYSLQ